MPANRRATSIPFYGNFNGRTIPAYRTFPSIYATPQVSGHSLPWSISPVFFLPPTCILNKVCGCFKTQIFVALRCLSAPRALGQCTDLNIFACWGLYSLNSQNRIPPRRFYCVSSATLLHLYCDFSSAAVVAPVRRPLRPGALQAAVTPHPGIHGRTSATSDTFPVYPFYKPLSCCRHDGIHDHAAMYSVIITASRSWPGTASASPSGMSKNILPVFAGDTDTYPCILPLSWSFRRMPAYRYGKLLAVANSRWHI